MLLDAGLYGGRERPLQAFASAGAFSKYGTWGHLEYTRQPPELAPKYRAVQVHARRPPLWCQPSEPFVAPVPAVASCKYVLLVRLPASLGQYSYHLLVSPSN
jgi:hypothetical protein